MDIVIEEENTSECSIQSETINDFKKRWSKRDTESVQEITMQHLESVNEKTGILCDGNNLEEIHSSIEKMLTNKKYEELGKNAKENSKNFYWDKIILEYKKILN